MGCNSCHRGVGSPSPGQTDVTSTIVTPPPAYFPVAPGASILDDTPWYKTPMGVFGIFAVIAGILYVKKRRA